MIAGNRAVATYRGQDLASLSRPRKHQSVVVRQHLAHMARASVAAICHSKVRRLVFLGGFHGDLMVIEVYLRVNLIWLVVTGTMDFLTFR